MPQMQPSIGEQGQDHFAALTPGQNPAEDERPALEPATAGVSTAQRIVFPTQKAMKQVILNG